MGSCVKFSAAVMMTLVGCISLLAAEDSNAVTIDDVRQLRRDRMRYAEIIEAIEQRGFGFELNEDSERSLRRIGFRPRDIQRLRELKSREAEVADGPVAENAALPLDAGMEDAHRRFAERVAKIRRVSQTNTVISGSEHITLICNQQLASTILPDIQRLEQLMARRFPSPLGTGPDKRVANIVLHPSRYDYEKWVRALFKVYEEEGMQFDAPDALNRAVRTERFLLDGIFMCCLEKMTPVQARHAVAYGVGYHYIDQLTHGKAPDPMMTGFGNLAEVMLLGRPSILLNSGYAERELGKGRNRWPMVVKQRFALNQVPPLDQLLEYHTSFMELPQYAEGWSFTSLLATDPKKFSSLLLAIRNDKAVLAEIESLYGLTADKLLARWKQFAMQQR